MSLRREMLRAASRAPTVLGNSYRNVIDYINSRFTTDGGACDRAGASDLYYTVFAIESLLALRREIKHELLIPYIRDFGAGDKLDFVHKCCLARCWACLDLQQTQQDAGHRLCESIERYRAADGGYGPNPKSDRGTIYHTVLALDAYDNLGERFVRPDGIMACVDSLRTSDGAYANEAALPIGSTPATAAAVTIMLQLGEKVPASVGGWLTQQCSDAGGFLAMPMAPVPDLLSTATALHALSCLECDLRPICEPCLNFLDSLWTGNSFRGHVGSDDSDCEYTYYGLLALGHLSE